MHDREAWLSLLHHAPVLPTRMIAHSGQGDAFPFIPLFNLIIRGRLLQGS